MISTAIKGTDTASGIDLTQLSSAGKSGGASFQKIMSKSLSSNVNNKASQNMVQTKTASGMKSTSTQQNTKQVSAQDDTAASTAKKTSDNTRSTLSDNSDKLTDAGEKIKDFLKEKLGVTDEEFEKDWHISDHRMLVVDIEEDDMRENDYKDTERRILCSVMERMFPDGGETYTIEEVKRLFEEEGVHEKNFEDALSKCIEEGWIIDCGNGNYTR